MKTNLANIILIVILLCSTISSLNGKSLARLNQNYESDSHNIAIDLVAIGAIPVAFDRNQNNSPSVSELMRDTYVRITDNNSESSEESEAYVVKTKDDITYEEYQATQRKKFCAIFCVLLLIFSILALYDSVLFKKSNRIISKNSAKPSISRIVLFVSIFLLIGSMISLSIVNLNLPSISLNTGMMMLIFISTYLINAILEKHDHGDNNSIFNKSNNEKVYSKQFSKSNNNYLKYIQYPIICLINMIIFLLPTWRDMQLFSVYDEQIVIQLISSLIFLITYAVEINLFSTFFSRQEFKHQNNY